MAFVPPTTFAFPTTLTRTWHVGHMALAVKNIQHLLRRSKIDLLLEVRDSRLPLTSINPAFEELMTSVGSRVGRIIVYGKRDLAQPELERPITNAVMNKGRADQIVWINTQLEKQVRGLYHLLVERAKSRNVSEEEQRVMRILIIGMPNVGKSSLLNTLRRVGTRKGKAAVTGAYPGLTRSISELVKISQEPLIYVKDTPGIMPPFLGSGAAGAERGMLLGITSGIKESLYPIETLAEYLLWRLTLRCFSPGEPSLSWSELMEHLGLPPDYPPSTPYHELLERLAKRIGAMLPGGIPDIPRTCKFLLEQFRKGKYGPWTLDHFPPPPPPLPESGEPEFDYSVPEQQADPKLSILDLGWKKDWVKTQGGIQQAVTMALNKREELSAREWTKRHKEVKKVMKQEGMHRAR
ncbi:P-loop containing nucleoside triphosphate hydrolase protein [Atractiella rhizophila]|nr:P-loop containing nucleoside triphosphate hydrolase protein [Atractiella rhizophila]